MTANTVTFTWADPTTMSDNTTPITAGFTIAIFDEASPNTPIGTVQAGVQTFTTNVLTPGDHNFAAVVSVGGQSSAPSPIVTVTVTGGGTTLAPNPVTNFTAVLNTQ